MKEKDWLLEEILSLLNEGMKKILLYGESSLSASQFQAFRRLVLDEFGKYGIEGRLRSLFRKDDNGYRAGT